ncbi:YoaK family protein [Flavobacterium sp. RHBU_3]|uniref:YoaK family protein n=1 Tax=Flavobacterium sp. RHBU_3 TaxID=3391184 RepID=UPI003984BC29
MDNKNINTITLVLALVAGYCDTVTFVAARNIFSAHVTGNFIVFAYQLVTGASMDAWIKLITFPIFIMAVMSGGWLAKNQGQKKTLLAEALLLLTAGILAFILHLDNQDTVVMYAVVLLVVFAMGMQNALGKVFSKATHGPTTMMTGNVTQASLDLRAILIGENTAEAVASLKKQSVTIFGFLGGCFLGGLLGKEYGLAAVALSGLCMIACYALSKKQD